MIFLRASMRSAGFFVDWPSFSVEHDAAAHGAGGTLIGGRGCVAGRRPGHRDGIGLGGSGLRFLHDHFGEFVAGIDEIAQVGELRGWAFSGAGECGWADMKRFKP
jgi:hypothetical protein